MFDILFSLNFIKRYMFYMSFSKASINKRMNWRQRSLNDIVSFAIKNSEFYRNLYNEKIARRDVLTQELPIINKKHLIEHFDEMVTVNEITKSKLCNYFKEPFSLSRKYLNKYLAFHTSGSTGNIAYVVWGPREFAIATSTLLINNIGLLDGNNLTELVFRRKKYAYIGIMDDYVGGNSWVYA